MEKHDNIMNIGEKLKENVAEGVIISTKNSKKG